MPLSNYLPSSRISQAGVIPNAAARPASPYEGQMVYQTDDNSLYIYDGSNWVKMVSASQPPALTLIAKQTVTNTNIDFTSIFTNEYDNYRVIYNGSARQAGGQHQVGLQLKSGSSVLSASGSYRWGRQYYSASAGGYSGNVSDVWIQMQDANTGQGFISFDIFSPLLEQKTAASGQTVSSEGATNLVFGINWVGENMNNNSYDGFRIASDSNMTATVSVYGYRK